MMKSTIEDEDDGRDNVYRHIESDRSHTVEEIASRLDTNTRFGLDKDEVAAKLTTEGYNLVHETAAPSEFYKLITNLVGLHNLPLWFGVSLYFLAFVHENFITPHEVMHMENLYFALVLILFVVSFGVFSYYMNAKCEYYLLACGDFVSSWAVVIREGVSVRILKEELVVGDLLLLSPGDQLRADVKLVETTGLKINTTILTSLVEHYYRLVYTNIDGYFHPGDVLLYSSYIESGNGKAIVIRTRDHFVSRSKVTRLSNKYPTRLNVNHPLTVEIDSFLRNLSFVGIGVGFVYATSSIFNGYNWLEAIIMSISLYVGIITEALLPTLNVCKSQISKDLASKNCYIQNVNVLELLGRTSTVVTNKTGILTQNKMIINRLWFDGRQWLAYDFLLYFRGETHTNEALKCLIRCGTLCNFALFSSKDKTVSPFVRKTTGKPTEVAMLRFWDAFWCGHREKYCKQFKRQFEFPFSPHRKCSLVVFKESAGNELLVALKGPPELFIEHSRFLVTSEGVIEFASNEKLALLEFCSGLSTEKEKLLAFAQFTIHEDAKIEDFDENMLKFHGPSMQFVGLASMLNPVRMSVLEAVFQCRRAGIKIIMTSGDHPELACSVASLIGLNQRHPRRYSVHKERDLIARTITVVSESQVVKMSDASLAHKIMSSEDLVFARVGQESKLRIIRGCKSKRSTVAVTGVRSNCMSVFNECDIRIALGIYGSDISKDNADIILLDDNFASIVHGIEHGRVLIENVRKSLCYTLSSKTAEVLLYPMYYLFQIPKLGSSFTIIELDLFTDNLPPIALAYELIEPHVMQCRPDELGKPMFSLIMLALFYYGFIQFLCGFLAYLVVMGDNGFWWSRLLGLRREWSSPAINDLEDSYGQEWTYCKRRELEFTCNTAYFDTIVIVRMIVLLCCRSTRESYLRSLFTNRMANFAIVFVVFFALLMSYYPPFQYGLRMYPLKLEWWLVGAPFGVIMMIFDEIRKWIIRNHPKSVITSAISY